MKPITLKKLRNFNLIMGVLHFVQGVAMLFLATTVIEKIAEFSPVITQNFLAFNTETMSLELQSKELFQLPFGILVASFLLILLAIFWSPTCKMLICESTLLLHEITANFKLMLL